MKTLKVDAELCLNWTTFPIYFDFAVSNERISFENIDLVFTEIAHQNIRNSKRIEFHLS